MVTPAPQPVPESGVAPARLPAASMWRQIGMGLALVALTAAVYSGAPRNGFIWDDDQYVVENENLRSPHGLWEIWTRPSASPQYYPLVFTTFWLEYHVWGLDPTGYHVVNIALHALGSVLVWRILKRLGIRGAWFAAAVFAVHPVHVESVAWITERKNTLSGVLYFSSLLVYLRLRGGVAESNGAERFPVWRYLLSLALFACALLSKTTTATLPAAILVLAWWRTGRVPWRDGRWLAPFFALALAAGILTVAVETHVVGTAGPGFDNSLAEKAIIAGRAVWFYARQLVWPAQVAFVYPRWAVDAQALGQWLYPLAAAALVLALALLVGRIGRGPLAAVLFFGGTLLPALGFFDIYYTLFSYVADHFQYLPSIGLIALLAAGGTAWAARLRQRLPGLAPILACGVILALSIQTWRAIPKYHDLEALWSDTLARNPESWMAHFGLGAVLDQRGQRDAAAEQYEIALRLHPCHVKSLANLAGYHADQNRLDEAAALLQRALECDPNDATTHANLGVICGRQNRPAEAVQLLARALELDPGLHELRVNYATALLANRRRDEAVRQLELVIEHKPALAQQLESHPSLPLVDTLSAAYAARYDFIRAARTARRAAMLASESGRTDIARALHDRAVEYERRQGSPVLKPVRPPRAP